ncbi:MAG: hypothetical protein ACXVPK_12140 [Tumebacillaceae bacterium]
MQKWNFSTNDEFFDCLDFHEAMIEKIQVHENKIIVDLESINVLAKHPLNPFDVAKNTGRCQLIFLEPIENEAVIFIEDKHPQPIKCTDFKEYEIYQFDRVESEKEVLYKIYGADNWFCDWVVKAKGIVVSWNEFNGDAWFVNWP